MQAALVTGKREIALRELPEPEPSAGKAVVEIAFCGICGTDLHIYNWDAWAQKTIPVPLVVGHDGFQ